MALPNLGERWAGDGSMAYPLLPRRMLPESHLYPCRVSSNVCHNHTLSTYMHVTVAVRSHVPGLLIVRYQTLDGGLIEWQLRQQGMAIPSVRAGDVGV